MDQALWESVRDILREIGQPVPDCVAGSIGEHTRMLDFAAFFDVDRHIREPEALADGVVGGAIARLQRRLAESIQLDAAPAGAKISNFDTSHFSADELDRMSRWWDTEPANRMALEAASEEEFANCRDGLGIAIEHLRAAAPGMAGETEIIVRDIVLAKPGPDSTLNYSGATSFGVWGAITINAETQRDWIQLYRQMVHETAHNLLFGMARDTPLVGADPSVRRRSPIRADLRPLDGIFHAAFVSAREAMALDALLTFHERECSLSQDDAEIVMETLELSVLAFWDCDATLRNDPDGLTALGDSVLTDCEAWMRANFDLEPI